MDEIRRENVRTYELESESEAPDYSSHLVGHVASIDDEGRASVVWPGRMLLPVVARSTVRVPSGDLLGSQVLLLFEGADPLRPIIVGVVHEAAAAEASASPVATSAPVESASATSAALAGEPREVQVDGESVVIDAQRELVLRCGKASLHLRRDGRVLIRGTHLLSRSTGQNRIQGASINLN